MGGPCSHNQPPPSTLSIGRGQTLSRRLHHQVSQQPAGLHMSCSCLVGSLGQEPGALPPTLPHSQLQPDSSRGQPFWWPCWLQPPPEWRHSQGGISWFPGTAHNVLSSGWQGCLLSIGSTLPPLSAPLFPHTSESRAFFSGSGRPVVGEAHVRAQGTQGGPRWIPRAVLEVQGRGWEWEGLNSKHFSNPLYSSPSKTALVHVSAPN